MIFRICLEIKAINCSFAKNLWKSLRRRTQERRTVYSPPLNFLKNLNKEPDFDKDSYTTLIKSELNALILCFAKGPEIKFYITCPR